MNIKSFLILSALIVAAIGFQACSNDKKSDSAESSWTPKIVTPVSEGNAIVVVSDTMPDGGYHIAFDAASIDKDGFVDVEFFSYDMYSQGAIDSIGVSDHIVILGKDITVMTINREIDDLGHKTVTINGSDKEVGHTLHLEDDGYYHAIVSEGIPEYYSAGKRRLQLTPDVSYTDDSNLVERVDASGPAAIAKVTNREFVPNSSSIVISNNKITHVNRIWVP